MNERIITFEGKRAVSVAKMLASSARMKILELTGEKPYSITQLSKQLGISQPAVTKHVTEMENEGLLAVQSGVGERGTTRMCSRNYDEIRLRLPAVNNADDDLEQSELTMPVGAFSQCEIHPTCGLASDESIIGFLDDPRSFYLPNRSSAEMLWFGWGFVEYEFPNILFRDRIAEVITLSMEICSEAPGYKLDYPSDIAFSVNGKNIGIWTCPGDMGGQSGLLNPSWWNQGTQYGFLKTISIKTDGSYIDGVKVSDTAIEDIIDYSRPSVCFRIEVKSDALHRGGVTIFGHNFGNYPQDIVMTMSTRPSK